MDLFFLSQLPQASRSMIHDRTIHPAPSARPRRAHDVVFVINPSLWRQSMYPSGILSLSSYLELHGIPNTIVDSRAGALKRSQAEREGALLTKVREMKPRLVCLSATHKEFDEAVRLNAAIKSIDDSIITVIGGSQPTYRPEDFLSNGFEFVCVGEGEKTLLAFARQALQGKQDWSSVEGLAWRQGANLVHNPPRRLMAESELDFDLISAYDKLDKRYFDFGVEIIRGLPLVGALLLTTRGCPYSCSFCGCNSIFGRKIRHRPLSSIRREIDYLVTRKHVEGIWILDDTFTISEPHALAVADILCSYNVIWGCQSRVDSLSSSFVSKLKARGCVQMDFGVESGSQRILDDIIGKRTKVAQVIESFGIARAHGIRTLANFIIGFPTESLEDLAATKGLAKRIKADVYVFSIATPLPGTRLYQLVGEDIRPNDYSALNWNGSELTERLNKSGIPNVVRERQRLKYKYLARAIRKSVFSWAGLKFILTRRRLAKRIQAALAFLFRTLQGT